jgi:UDP-N-acetylmuramate dehydrogenase
MQTKIQENVSLKNYSTMRLGGQARYLCEVTSAHEVGAVIDWAETNSLPVVMVGEGSNVIWSDAGFPGLVIVNKILGYDLQDQGDQQFLIIGAGENWDSVVERSVTAGLSGLEQLSLIPGTAGATPVQNVGAYGREIAEVLVCVQAYDKKDKKLIIIPKSECGFSYRNSKFKGEDKGRFFITSVTVTLSHSRPLPPFYSSVQQYLSDKDIKNQDVTPAEIRAAVMAIRTAKLPDPKEVANCGSFFHNPIIPLSQLEELREKYPSIVSWQVGDDDVKVSAGWLLEQLGLKGYHEPNTGMAIWPKQALVFVNEKATSTAQLLAFRDAIMKAVQDKFGITLQQEPELI